MNYDKAKPSEDRCYYDSKLKVMVHKFKMGATKCECGINEIKPREYPNWKNRGGRR